MKFWVNTSAEYNKLAENIDPDTLYFITDDDEDYGSLALDFSRHKVDPLAHGEVNTKLDRHKNDPSIHTPALTADKTIYVSPTGSDETGDGSQAKPYKTGRYAFSILPQNFNGYNASIDFANGIYDELISLKYYYGGKLYIYGNQSTTKGFDISNISDISIINLKMKNTDTTLTLWQTGLYLDSCEFEATNKNDYYNSAISVQQSKIYGRNLIFNNCNRLIYTASGSIASLVNISGAGNEYRFKSDGSLLSVTNNTATSRLGDEDNQGVLLGGNQIKNFKPEFSVNGISFQHKAEYVKNNNMVSVELWILIDAINSTADPESIVSILGLPYNTTDQSKRPANFIHIYGANGLDHEFGYCTFTNNYIVLNGYVQNNAILLKLKNLKVGTVISFIGHYFTEG